jgi:hypothetical protein
MTFFFSSFQLNTLPNVKNTQIMDLEKLSMSELTLNKFRITADALYGCKINFKDEDQKENY